MILGGRRQDDMFYDLKNRVGRMHFDWAVKAVLRSGPLLLDPLSTFALLSQLQHKDLLMFLLAAKSFARQVRPRAVFVLNDGSLTDRDRALLREHIPGVTLLELSQYRSIACPRGGCWERLLAISTLVRDYYVVQLDSDTLSVGPIDEVRDCVRGHTAFALGTWDNQECEQMREQWGRVTKRSISPESHVQLVAEANFDKLNDFASLRYVRGCAGFAGFPRGSFGLEFVERMSTEMRAAIGKKWEEWGSEQVMSNIVVANVPGAVVLPHPKYADCHKMKRGETMFVHFIGSCRFAGGTYAKLAADVIAHLKADNDDSDGSRRHGSDG